MSDRIISRNTFNDNATTNGALESPWTDSNSFRQLNQRHLESAVTALPSLSLAGAENAGRPVGSDPNIIQLVGGGTKDLRQADQPFGNDAQNGSPRRLLSPQEYAEKLRQVEREP
ncbi:MAG TPA: hypothetical protein PKZ32_19100, partial [Candidatus Melainabacteria bacterium]|nr:hypothetical protein [Candidatus Melainabacteria bacterium]